VKLFVLDTHTIYRRGLVACLDRLDEVEAVADAESVRDAWEHPALFAADLVLVDPSLPGGGELRGVLEFREFLEGMMEHLEEAYPEPEEFMAAGGKLIVLGTWHARARETGRTVAVPFAHVFEMQDGKFNYFRNYIDSSEALELLAESRG